MIQGESKVKLGLRLRLVCLADAHPASNNYSWYFKQEHTHSYITLLQTQSSYCIEPVDVSNAGLYMCSATNTIGQGEKSTEFQVSVYCKYSFLHILYTNFNVFVSSGDVRYFI